MNTLCSNTLRPSLDRRLGVVALVIGASIALGACASRPPAPTAQMAVSSAAVADATRAGATESAPAEMSTARDKLERAKVALAAKDYALARSLAQEAELDAQLAEVKTHSSKSSAAAVEVQEGIRVLREEMDRKTR